MLFSLRDKLAVAFALVLLPVLAIIVVDFLSDFREREETLLEGQMSTAQAVGAMLDAVFDQAVAVGESFTLDPVVLTFDHLRLDPYLARFLPRYPGYESINVWDASGNNVGASVPQPSGEPRPNIADREHFQRAMATGNPAVSEVLVARTTNRPAAAVVVPVKDEAGRPIGAISVVMDLDEIARRLQTVGLRPGQAIFVADRTGRLALHTLRPQLAWEERDVPQYQPVREALEKGHFYGYSAGIWTGEPELVAGVRTPIYEWVAGVSLPEDLALAGIRRRAWTTGGLYLGAAAIAGLLAVGLIFTFTRPLRQLSGAMAAFGRGELDRRVQIRTGDELEATAETFNRMAASLQREQGRLHFLGEMGTALSSTLDVDRVARLLAERSAEVLGEAAWVCILPPTGRAPCRIALCHATEPALQQRLEHLFRRYHDWMAEHLIPPLVESGEPISIPEVASSDLHPDLRKELAGLGALSMLIVPLKARESVVGALATTSFSQDRPLGREELALAVDLATRAGLVVDNALLFQAIQDERLRLQTILETVPVGVAVAEAPAGRIVMMNRAGQQISGRPLIPVEIPRWQREYALYRPTGEPYPPEDMPLARSLLRGETVAAEEMLMRRPSGREVNLLVHSAPLKDAEGRLVGAVASFQDITPIKELERAREEFISVVAHDLRSPLTVITGYAGMLLRSLPARARGERRAAEGILSSARRLEKMVADLLDASRIEARRLKLECQPVELPRLVREVVERAAEITQGHPVRVQVHGKVPGVEADPSRLEQVLVNLLSNAAKYSFPDTGILVEVEGRPQEVLVSVTNQGQGIPTEDREVLFTRFHRARAAVAEKVPGLGLGLYITRGLVEAHGGRIWVESEEGRYAAFRFTLPLPPGAPPPGK